MYLFINSFIYLFIHSFIFKIYLFVYLFILLSIHFPLIDKCFILFKFFDLFVHLLKTFINLFFSIDKNNFSINVATFDYIEIDPYCDPPSS